MNGIPSKPGEKRKAAPWARKFRKKAPAALPDAEQSRRQDSVLRYAWHRFGESGAAIAFLNTHNDPLGGQPLLIALESDEGLVRVERSLRETVLPTGKVPT